MKNQQTQEGFITQVVIVILFLFLVGGVYFWYKTKSTQPVNNQPASAEIQNEANQFHVSVVDNSSSTNISNTVPVITGQTDMVSKPCTSGIQPEESQSPKYAALIGSMWTFEKAILSDFNCDGKKDLLIASYVYIPSESFFKGNLQYFEGTDNNWKLIGSNEFLGEPFDISAGKTPEGANAVILTFKSNGNQFQRTIWIINGRPTGI